MRILMGLDGYSFLLALFLLCLALLWRLCWFHLQPSHSPAGRRRTPLHRLLKPRTPLDCPICRLSSSSVRPASVPVRPWCEVKSRRGAPKRIHTDGFACPNQQCHTLASPMLTSMLSSAMARMAVQSGSRRFAVRPARPRSARDATPPCIV